MFYIVYQITNLVNGKTYIGAHATTNLDDGYMSSSKLVKYAISKHGIENFSKEILHHCSSEDEMFRREKELVNSLYVARPDTYNLTEGGTGSWSHWNDGSDKHRIACQKGAKNVKQRFNVGPLGKDFRFDRNETHRKTTQASALSQNSQKKKKATYKNIKHQQGHKNSQFGTRWYTDGVSRKKFMEGKQPNGWMTTAEYREQNKQKTNSAYGKHWYNDGKNSYLLLPTDDRVQTLRRGRLIAVN